MKGSPSFSRISVVGGRKVWCVKPYTKTFFMLIFTCSESLRLSRIRCAWLARCCLDVAIPCVDTTFSDLQISHIHAWTPYIHVQFRYIDISNCYFWDVATEDLLSALYELKRQTCFHSTMISMTLQALTLCTFARVIVCIFLSSTFKRKHWIWRWHRERGTRRTPQQDGRERSIHPRGPEKCGEEMRLPFVSLALLHSPPSPVPCMQCA